MGTNFYFKRSLLDLPEDTDSDDPRIHIGKRSAAGLYCWDCDETLHKEGRERIHYSVPEHYWPNGRVNTMDLHAMVRASENVTYKCCPKCGQAPAKSDSFSEGPAAIELGFAKPRAVRPTGVCGTSSFSWAQDPEKVGRICEQHADEPIIEDEYGREMAGHEFLDMLLSNCGIQYTHSIGVMFC